MRCKNCGTENPDGSRFCATCGKPLEQEEPAKNVAEQKEEAVQNAEEQKEEVAQNTEETLTSTAETKSLTHKKSRGLNKFLIGLACAVVVVVIAAGLLISRARRTIDLNKYVTFETTGYNGYGNVYPQIDWEKIQKKYDSRLKFTKELWQSFNRFLIISLDVLICRYSPLFRAFPALFISEEPHKSFYYPLCFRSQK